MRLKTLELQGFKSFPDKTVISFDRGITVVVGPNGSGKSNISDAMRWVLGEMSTKSIRGTKMEDVIFAGSQKRSPMGYAEVTVTFDNTEEDGKILSMAEYDEISVTRRYYRVGDSEYFINRKPARLRDINDLFMNTGLGKGGYSIIGQGKIAEIISQKNDERRAIFEEAAGIARYRFQKTEATRKLDATNENLVRLEDIAGVLGERVGPLEKDAEKAKKYLEIRDAKMAIDISLSLYDIDNAKTDTDELSSKLILSKAELDEADETRASLEASEERTHEESTENQIEREKLSAKVLELTTALHENDAKIKLSENDVEHLRAEIGAANARIRAAEATASNAKAEWEKVSGNYAQAERAMRALSAKAGKAAEEVEAAEEALSENARQNTGNETRMAELRAAQTDAAIAASVAEAQKESASQKCDELSESIEKHESDIRMLDDRMNLAKEKIAGYVKKEEAIKAQLDEIDRVKAEYDGKMQALSAQKNDQFLEISSRKHKIQNLVRMEELLEGYSGAVRFVVSEHKGGKITLPSGVPIALYGPLSTLISVPDRYSAAIEIAFGQSLQNLVVEDEESAKAAIAYLKKKSAGRATFYPVSTMRGTELTEADLPAGTREGFLASASALVDCEEKFRGIVRSLLGRILIVDDIEHANKIAKAMNFRYRIVTLDGQVINAGGSFTGGSLSTDGRILSRRVQIDKLGEEVKALEAAMAATEKEMKDLTAKREETERSEGGVLSTASMLKAMHDAEQTQLTVLESNRKVLADALELLIGERDAAASKSTREENDREALERKRAAFTEELTAAEALTGELAKEKEQLAAALDAARAAFAAVNVEVAKEETNLSMLAQMRDTAAARVSEIEANIEEQKTFIAQANAKIDAGGAEAKAIREESDRIEAELAACDTEKTTLTERAAALEKKLNELRVRTRDLGEKRDLLYRTYTRLEAECETLRERQDKLMAFLWDEYELTYSDAVKKCGERVTKETRAEAVASQTKYKNQLRALGNVNVGAIEEYRDVKKQFDGADHRSDDVLHGADEDHRLARRDDGAGFRFDGGSDQH